MGRDRVVFILFVLLVVFLGERLSVRIRLILPRPFGRLVQDPSLEKTTGTEMEGYCLFDHKIIEVS